MEASFSSERDGRVAVWTINRPAARNAVDGELARALERGLEEVEQDREVRAVVVTGAGDKAFVAGADLKFLKNAPLAERAQFDQRMFDLTARYEALPVPIVAALNGVVMGGGCEYALACDLRIGAPHTSFTFKHAALGVTPGWGGLGRLTKLVGKGTAAKLLYTATTMPADEALRTGLIDEIHDAPLERAMELAQAIAAAAPRSVAQLKRMVGQAYREGLAPKDERDTFLRRALEPDHAAALKAVFDKSEPEFEPRD